MRKIMWTVLIVIAVFFGFASVFLYKQNTTVPELGHAGGKLKPTPSTPNAVSTQTEDTDKKVEPLPFKEDLNSTMAALIGAINTYDGSQIITQDTNYLYVVFTTKLLKFKDDAEFYLDESTHLVHFRSASRAGKSDLGLNRERYQKLRATYLHD